LGSGTGSCKRNQSAHFKAEIRDTFEGKVKRILNPVIAALLVCVFIFVFVLCEEMLRRPIIERGEAPVFDFTLIDNGENDYAIVEYVQTGTGACRLPNPLHLYGLVLRIWSPENLYKYYDFDFPPTMLHTGEGIRIYFRKDAIAKGKFYRVSICSKDGGILWTCSISHVPLRT
jgi:hypothetical protein